MPPPYKTVPYPLYERALAALGLGDLDGTLSAHVRLLREIAEILTDTPAGPDGTPETVPSWVEDVDLREQIGIEADRLRQSAASWVTNGLPPLDNRIADMAARDAYLAAGHADIVDENGDPRVNDAELPSAVDQDER